MTRIITSTFQKPKIVFNPNPVIDSFQISGFDGNATLVISDFNCRVIHSQQILCDETISLHNIPRGIYVAKIITPNGIEHRKLEKK